MKLMVLGVESGALRFGAVEEGASCMVSFCCKSAILEVQAGRGRTCRRGCCRAVGAAEPRNFTSRDSELDMLTASIVWT